MIIDIVKDTGIRQTADPIHYVKAMLNILEDSEAEKLALEAAQKAILNILIDFEDERNNLVDIHKAVLNILEDVDTVKNRIEQINHEMTEEVVSRKGAEEKIRKFNTELEQRIAERMVQLKESNENLEAFAYAVTHDLRAPLRHIDGFIIMLKENLRTANVDKSSHYMEVISNSTKKMATLLDDLLQFSRISRDEILKSEINMEVLVRDIIQKLKPETEGREIKWKIAPLELVRGDANMLRIVLLNLISNALKFTRTKKIAKIEIGCDTSNQNELVFFIRDNGVGFDMNYVNKLFGLFQRLHSADKFEGNGIGLANIRRIITRHGGRTWAEGKVDGGASFYFSLPKTGNKTAGQLTPKLEKP